MPDREVQTIRDLIFYQYAKIIAKSALGPEAKKTGYGFIKTTFRQLRDDDKKWSEILREDRQLIEAEKRCAYCCSDKDLQWEHIVPKSLRINDRCPDCDRIQGIHNQIWACRSCNTRKGAKGLYRFFKELHPGGRNNMRFVLTKSNNIISIKSTDLPSLFTMLKLGGFFYGL